MVAYNKIQIFVEDLAEAIHDLDTDQLTVALTAAANAPVATNNVLADITEIAYTNLSARDITLTSSVHTTGTYKIILADLVLTATGAVATFRYVAIYNDGTVGKVNPLIAWYDHGSDVTLANGETFTIDFDDTNGFFQLV
ncbi:hypothetical protein LCGC14_2789480 [marine sediment metagenome]|uniref:Uncharacterized protein n=1 Tax=marine sediment metagenome TaxID=412755 RepID=A0A0F8YQY5_9ZZZZ